MADLLDIRPERNDSDQRLLRKILAALNLWLGGIVPGQSGNINIDSSAGAGQVTVVPVPGDGSAGAITGDRSGGYTTAFIYSPTKSAGAYAVGDAIGSRAPLLAVLRPGVGTGILQSLTVFDAAKQSQPIDFLFFSQEPSNSTATDNAAVVVAAADVPYFLGKVSVTEDDYIPLPGAGGGSVATVGNVGLVLKVPASTGLGAGTVWVVAVTQGTPTYAGALQFGFGVLQD